MRALAVTPRTPRSAQVLNVPTPVISDDEVLVRVKDVGVCGTDLEINEGLYGAPPPEDGFLILGHESLGVVEAVGKNVLGLNPGTLVAATVRRPCLDCHHCNSQESDMCLTGKFTERGIGGRHGFMSEYYKEQPSFLVEVPVELASVGVLLEPLSICEKAMAQLYMIQKRMSWKPRTALVTGAGVIGLFSTMLLRLQGLEVFTLATRSRDSRKAAIVEECGARYLNSFDNSLRFDIIIEATGNSAVAFRCMELLNINGIICLTSVTGGSSLLNVPADKINIEFVLGNKTAFGTVNSNASHFRQGIGHLSEFEQRWPGLTGKLITKRISFADFDFNKDKEDIKIVLQFS